MISEEKNSASNQSGITDILLLQQRLRLISGLPELGHILVNDSRKLVSYRTAVLWLSGVTKKKGDIAAISGIPKTVRDAPFTVWVRQLCQHLGGKETQEPLDFTSNDLPDEITADWNEYFPLHAIWLPLFSPAGNLLGGILLVRENSWQDQEKYFLKYWADTAAYSIEHVLLQKRRWLHFFRSLKNQTRIAIGFFLLALLWLRVPLSVLAPAEVVPSNPIIVRAPLDGVIEEVLVAPNQTVRKGTLLLKLDDTALQAKLDVALQELEIAKAEYRRAEQASVTERGASAQIPILRVRIDQRAAEAVYVRSLLDRIVIHSEIDGVAILPDSHELEGRPVKIGERILALADPASAELESWLAVGDSIPLSREDKVDLFLNVAPGKPSEARLRSVNYQAEVSPDGILAFRVRADFSPEETVPRIGLRGVAKLYSHKVPLYYYLFRRPFSAIRQWLGL